MKLTVRKHMDASSWLCLLSSNDYPNPSGFGFARLRRVLRRSGKVCLESPIPGLKLPQLCRSPPHETSGTVGQPPFCFQRISTDSLLLQELQRALGRRHFGLDALLTLLASAPISKKKRKILTPLFQLLRLHLLDFFRGSDERED